MQFAPSAPSMPPFAPVGAELSENSRLGFEAKNPAWNPDPSAANSTATIGFRASLFLDAIRQSHCARYYNPLTDRFVSREPEDGDLTDPKTLHKYLYAGGNPINKTDSTGRDFVDVAVIVLLTT